MSKNHNALSANSVAPGIEAVAADAVGKFDYCAGDLSVNCKEKLVVVAGTEVDLTNAEFNMLETLLRNRGKIVTKAELTEAGLSRPLEKHDRSVDMHVSNLRKKIGLTSLQLVAF